MRMTNILYFKLHIKMYGYLSRDITMHMKNTRQKNICLSISSSFLPILIWLDDEIKPLSSGFTLELGVLDLSICMRSLVNIPEFHLKRKKKL